MSVNSFCFLHELLNPVHRLFDVIEGGRIGATDVTFAEFSESRFGNDGNFLLLE